MLLLMRGCVRVCMRVAGLLLLHFWLYGWVGFDKKTGRERKARAWVHSGKCVSACLRVSAEQWVFDEGFGLQCYARITTQLDTQRVFG